MVQMGIQYIAATTLTQSCGPTANLSGYLAKNGADGVTFTGLRFECQNGNVSNITWGTVTSLNSGLLNATYQISVFADMGGTYINGFRFVGANQRSLGLTTSTNNFTLSCGSTSNLINGLAITYNSSIGLTPTGFAIFCQSGDTYKNETVLNTSSQSSTASFALASSQVTTMASSTTQPISSQTLLGVETSQVTEPSVKNTTVLISAIVSGVILSGILLGGLASWTTSKKRQQTVRTLNLETLPSNLRSYISQMTTILGQSHLYHQTQIAERLITTSAIEHIAFDASEPETMGEPFQPPNSIVKASATVD